MNMRVLVTGGAGFIGSNFIRYILGSYLSYRIINLDKLTYAGNPENCADFEKNPNYKFVKGDITDKKLAEELAEKTDVIINFAAETHVDRSIEDATEFIRSNVIGTQVLLDAAKKCGHERYIQISTDEVYGDIEEGMFTENSPIRPSSPYAASKAAADMLCMAYHRTYATPVIISRCSNNYGPYQYPEKLVPFFIKKLISGEKAPVYGNGLNVRDWLHVRDHCRAVDMILHHGKPGQIYNISANEEHSNLDIATRIIDMLKQGKDRIEFVKDRPGHDVRYALNADKIKKELGWEPEVEFESGFKGVVEWYKEHLT
jgi:dTDP-glucose 4,6-dehydratase